MILTTQRDITEADEDIIAHQVNCQAAMGSGVALALMKKFPSLKKEYLKFCEQYDSPESRLGEVQILTLNTGWASKIVGKEHTKIIANLFGQLEYGRDANKRYTDYAALEKGLKTLKDYAKERNLSVCLPYGIGCGLANGDWTVVYSMIEDIFSDYQVRLYRIS